MKSKWWKISLTVFAVLLTVSVLMGTVSSVWAQNLQNGMGRFGNQAGMYQPRLAGNFAGGPMHNGFRRDPAGTDARWGGQGGATLVTIAKTLDLTVAELQAALQGGKSVADVAKAQGVALTKVVDAVLADRQSALKAAVAAKRITQAQADQILANMKANLPAHLTTPFTPRAMRGHNALSGMQGGAGGWRMAGGRGGMGLQHPFGRWNQPESSTQPNQ